MKRYLLLFAMLGCGLAADEKWDSEEYEFVAPVQELDESLCDVEDGKPVAIRGRYRRHSDPSQEGEFVLKLNADKEEEVDIEPEPVVVVEYVPVPFVDRRRVKQRLFPYLRSRLKRRQKERAMTGDPTKLRFGQVQARGGVPYWRFTGEGIPYALSTAGPQGSGALTQVVDVEPTFAYGFEGSLRYTAPGRRWYAAIGGSMLTMFATSNAVPPPGGTLESIFDPVPSALTLNFARARWRISYICGDTQFGLRLTPAQRTYAVHAIGGIRYARINFTEKFGYLTINNLNVSAVQQHSFAGVGPRLGVEGYWQPFKRSPVWALSGIGLEGQLAMFGIFGHRNLRIISQSGNVLPFFGQVSGSQTFPKASAVLPGVDFRMAACYQLPIGPLKFGAELGYALSVYFDAQQRIVRTFDETPNAEISDAGFAGPYIMLRIVY